MAFWAPGKMAVTVLDPAGQHRQTVGLEFGQTDDDIGFQDRPGDTDAGQEVRIEIHFDALVADIAVTAQGGRHQPRLAEACFIVAVAEKARIVPHHDLGRIHALHFSHDGFQNGRVG